MTCIYCDGETDTGGACVAQCYWSQNKRWNTRPIEDALRAELEKRTAELHYANTACIEMKHELARLKAERRWIPVSERLPKYGEPSLTIYHTKNAISQITIRCLVEDRDDKLRVIWYDIENGLWVNGNNITHWMPLPPAPESEG